MRYSPLFLLFVFNSAFSFDSLRLENREGIYFIIHQVDQGETVYSISKRYQIEPSKLILANQIQDNYISIEQILEIPFENNQLFQSPRKDNAGAIHIVLPGETLFSVARKYELTVEQVKEWNGLTKNELSVGQELVVAGDKDELIVEEEQPAKPPNPGYIYYVQTGENLRNIATKFKTTPDSIKQWNELNSEELSIGQQLYFPFEVNEDSVLAVVSEVPKYNVTTYGSKRRSSERGGITRVVEEGIARPIESDMKTTKYLALHRKLKVGDILEVKNLMNNKTAYVRVVGTLPNTGINKNVMIRLTESVFENLGIIDKKALVEITYFEN